MMQLPLFRRNQLFINVLKECREQMFDSGLTEDKVTVYILIKHSFHFSFVCVIFTVWFPFLADENLRKVFFQEVPLNRTIWVTKHYNSRYCYRARNRHDLSFPHKRGKPFWDVENYSTRKTKRIPGSVAHVSVVTVRLVRRRLPAAVRRAASRQTGKTQHYHLQ